MAEETDELLVAEVDGSAPIEGEDDGFQADSLSTRGLGDRWASSMRQAEAEINASIARAVERTGTLQRLFPEEGLSVRSRVHFTAGSLNWHGQVRIRVRRSHDLHAFTDAGTRRQIVDYLSRVIEDAVNSEVMKAARYFARDSILSEHPLGRARTLVYVNPRQFGLDGDATGQGSMHSIVFPREINIHHHDNEKLSEQLLALKKEVESLRESSARDKEAAAERILKRQKWILTQLLLTCVIFAMIITALLVASYLGVPITRLLLR